MVHRLLEKIARQMLAFYRFCEPMIRESLHPDYHWQHASGVKGKLLLREDSTLLMSPKMYRDIVMPQDIMLANELRGIAIHFCGNGEHQLDNYLSIPGLHMLDLGQPEMMNMAVVYGKAAAQPCCAGPGHRPRFRAPRPERAPPLPRRCHSDVPGRRRRRRTARLAALRGIRSVEVDSLALHHPYERLQRHGPCRVPCHRCANSSNHRQQVTTASAPSRATEPPLAVRELPYDRPIVSPQGAFVPGTFILAITCYSVKINRWWCCAPECAIIR